MTTADILVAINVGVSTDPQLGQSIINTYGSDLGASLLFYCCSEYQGKHCFMVKDKNIPCEEYPPVSSWMVT